MNILLLGSTGFIGRHVTKQLQAEGHTLITPSRQDLNFSQFHLTGDEQAFSQYLSDVDIIINMVGIMHHNQYKLEQVHHHTPLAMAQAFKAYNLAQPQAKRIRWVQLSALGADPNHKVAFVGSKGRCDAALLALADEHFSVAVARPSVVFGRGGASCELFIKLAKLPVLCLPKAGNYQLQPVHVQDVAQGLVTLATQPNITPSIINFTGADVSTLADYISMMRQNIHHSSPLKVFAVPYWLVKLTAFFANIPSNGMLSLGSLQLLNEGSVANCNDFSQLLGRVPCGFNMFGITI